LPVEGSETLGEDNADRVKVPLELLNRFSGDTIDSLKGMEVFEYDSHIEVLDTKLDTLKVNCFNVLDIHHEARELRYSNQAVSLSRSDFDLTLDRTTHEINIFNRHIDVDWGSVRVGLVVHKLRESVELL
jgi:hypothetical protein